MDNRYSRQILVQEIGEEGQESIRSGVAVVIGLGALGSTSAGLLARAGVGTLRLVDRDFVDWSNLQRQALYDENDASASMPKAIAASEHLMLVNSEVAYEPVVDDVNPANVERLVTGATVVVDGLDNFYTRALINQACVKLRIPWIHGACLATYGEAMSIVPGVTACYECALPGVADATFALTCDTAGILGPVAFTIGSLQAMEALKVLAGHPDEVSSGITMVDLWHTRFDLVKISRRPDCPVCGVRRFDLLSESDRISTVSICGRNAVQVVPDPRRAFQFDAVSAALRRVGEVSSNDYLLKARIGPNEIVLFCDGRAIIFGTVDPLVAKSIYSRYIGG
ncbi:MAG: ThiF family adenylyltransferase [Bacillota bacterium]|nr:ThiF family adenylyltransferase [Bacillota bacterium]